MIKAVLFDWSGTLCNDHHQVTSGIKKHFFNPYVAKIIFFHPLISSLRYNLALQGIKIPYFLRGNYTASLSAFPLFPHIRKTLNFLKKEQLTLGVLSTQSQKVISKSIRSHNLQNLFDFIEGSIFHKAPYINNLSKKLNLKRDQILYLSDLSQDIEEVKGCGIITCAASWGYESSNQLELVKPDFIIDSIQELKSIVDKINYHGLWKD